MAGAQVTLDSTLDQLATAAKVGGTVDQPSSLLGRWLAALGGPTTVLEIAGFPEEIYNTILGAFASPSTAQAGSSTAQAGKEKKETEIQEQSGPGLPPLDRVHLVNFRQLAVRALTLPAMTGTPQGVLQLGDTNSPPAGLGGTLPVNDGVKVKLSNVVDVANDSEVTILRPEKIAELFSDQLKKELKCVRPHPRRPR